MSKASKCEYYESDDDDGTPMASYLEDFRLPESKVGEGISSPEGDDAIELVRGENDFIHGMERPVADSKDSAGGRDGGGGGKESSPTERGRGGLSASPRLTVDADGESKYGGGGGGGGGGGSLEELATPLPTLSEEERAGLALALIFGDDWFPLSAAWTILQRTMLFYGADSGRDVMQRLIGDGKVVVHQQQVASSKARSAPASFRVATETLVEAVALVPRVVRPATRRVLWEAYSRHWIQRLDSLRETFLRDVSPSSPLPSRSSIAPEGGDVEALRFFDTHEVHLQRLLDTTKELDRDLQSLEEKGRDGSQVMWSTRANVRHSADTNRHHHLSQNQPFTVIEDSQDTDHVEEGDDNVAGGGDDSKRAAAAAAELRKMLPTSVPAELLPVFIDAVFENPALALRLTLEGRETLIQRLRRWAERRGHARGLARMSLELSKLNIERGEARTAKEDAEVAETLLKPLLPADQNNDTGSFAAINTGALGGGGGSGGGGDSIDNEGGRSPIGGGSARVERTRGGSEDGSIDGASSTGAGSSSAGGGGRSRGNSLERSFTSPRSSSSGNNEKQCAMLGDGLEVELEEPEPYHDVSQDWASAMNCIAAALCDMQCEHLVERKLEESRRIFKDQGDWHGEAQALVIQARALHRIAKRESQDAGGGGRRARGPRIDEDGEETPADRAVEVVEQALALFEARFVPRDHRLGATQGTHVGGGGDGDDEKRSGPSAPSKGFAVVDRSGNWGHVAMLDGLYSAAQAYIERGAPGDKERALAAAERAIAVAGRLVVATSSMPAAEPAGSPPGWAELGSGHAVGHVVLARAKLEAARTYFSFDRVQDAHRHAKEAKERHLIEGAGLREDDKRVVDATKDIGDYFRQVRRTSRAGPMKSHGVKSNK